MSNDQQSNEPTEPPAEQPQAEQVQPDSTPKPNPLTTETTFKGSLGDSKNDKTIILDNKNKQSNQ
jgi:hypothetical protein